MFEQHERPLTSAEKRMSPEELEAHLKTQEMVNKAARAQARKEQDPTGAFPLKESTGDPEEMKKILKDIQKKFGDASEKKAA